MTTYSRSSTSSRIRALSILPWVLMAGVAEAERIRLGLVLEDKINKQLDIQAMNAVSGAFDATRRFYLVERKELSRIFEEKSLKDIIGDGAGSLFETWDLQMMGFVSYSVDRSDKTTTYTLAVRLADVSTGEVLGTFDSTRTTLVPPLSLALAGDHLATNLREIFPPEGMVIRVVGKKQVMIDLGSGMGLKQGDSLEIFRKGEPFPHPVSGLLMPGEEISVGKLVVDRLGLQTSICKVKSSKGPVEELLRVRYQSRLQGKVGKLMPKSLQRWAQRVIRAEKPTEKF